eukprot:COSAG05_NODE_1395_length_4993_cov_6.265836_8_plen_84_part_00
MNRLVSRWAQALAEGGGAHAAEDKSLCLFRHDSSVRQACGRITKSKRFDSIVLAAIVISSVLLAVEHPNDDPETVKARVLSVR